MLIPPVSRYMTTQPWTIERGASLRDAGDLMRAHVIRHLPVLEDGHLVGVVSERDLRLLEHPRGPDARIAQVDEVMTARPFVVTGDTALDEVVAIMGEHKYGSAIVVGHDGVEGIFTAIDACRALADILEQHRLE